MFSRIEEIVGSHFGVSVEELRGDGKRRDVTDAKHFIWYILRDIYGYECSDIARVYGSSRSNVFHRISDIRCGVRLQPFYANHLNAIQDVIRQEGLSF